jgi:hypothetical protein
MTRELIIQIHSLMGVLIFSTGLLQIVLKKEGARHRLIGNIYLYSWLLLLISGAYLGGLIITIVGVFGFYFALTGARIGHLKNNNITLLEKLIFSIGGVSALAMLYYSVILYGQGDKSFSTIFAVFGALFLFTTVRDIFKYILGRPLEKDNYGKLDWYFQHLFRMSISFIAAVTAFTSIQNVFNHNTLNFLMPTVIGMILINLAKRNYKKKFIIKAKL